jgi:hypothetical protein
MPAKSKTAKFYAANPESRKKRLDYQKEYNKKPREVAKRVELNKYNRDHNAPKGDRKDASHSGGKITGYSPESKNRGDKNNSPGDKRARGGKKR